MSELIKPGEHYTQTLRKACGCIRTIAAENALLSTATTTQIETKPKVTTTYSHCERCSK